MAGAYDPATGGIRPTAAFEPDLASLRSYGLPAGLDAPAFVREFLARSRRAAAERGGGMRESGRPGGAGAGQRCGGM